MDKIEELKIRLRNEDHKLVLLKKLRLSQKANNASLLTNSNQTQNSLQNNVAQSAGNALNAAGQQNHNLNLQQSNHLNSPLPAHAHQAQRSSSSAGAQSQRSGHQSHVNKSQFAQIPPSALPPAHSRASNSITAANSSAPPAAHTLSRSSPHVGNHLSRPPITTPPNVVLGYPLQQLTGHSQSGSSVSGHSSKIMNESVKRGRDSSNQPSTPSGMTSGHQHLSWMQNQTRTGGSVGQGAAGLTPAAMAAALANMNPLAAMSAAQQQSSQANSTSSSPQLQQQLQKQQLHQQMQQQRQNQQNHIQLLAQKQAAAKLNLRKQLERSLLHIATPPRLPPLEINLIPNGNNQEFIYYVGLESCVDYLTSLPLKKTQPQQETVADTQKLHTEAQNQEDAFDSKDVTEQDKEDVKPINIIKQETNNNNVELSEPTVTSKPFECLQCGTDFTPKWHWKDSSMNNKMPLRPWPSQKTTVGCENQKPAVLCDNCVQTNLKKSIRAEHTSKLKSAFLRAQKEEKELEQRLAIELTASPPPVPPPAPALQNLQAQSLLQSASAVSSSTLQQQLQPPPPTPSSPLVISNSPSPAPLPTIATPPVRNRHQTSDRDRDRERDRDRDRERDRAYHRSQRASSNHHHHEQHQQAATSLLAQQQNLQQSNSVPSPSLGTNSGTGTNQSGNAGNNVSALAAVMANLNPSALASVAGPLMPLLSQMLALNQANNPNMLLQLQQFLDPLQQQQSRPSPSQQHQQNSRQQAFQRPGNAMQQQLSSSLAGAASAAASTPPSSNHPLPAHAHQRSSSSTNSGSSNRHSSSSHHAGHGQSHSSHSGHGSHGQGHQNSSHGHGHHGQHNSQNNNLHKQQQQLQQMQQFQQQLQQIKQHQQFNQGSSALPAAHSRPTTSASSAANLAPTVAHASHTSSRSHGVGNHHLSRQQPITTPPNIVLGYPVQDLRGQMGSGSGSGGSHKKSRREDNSNNNMSSLHHQMQQHNLHQQQAQAAAAAAAAAQHHGLSWLQNSPLSQRGGGGLNPVAGLAGLTPAAMAAALASLNALNNSSSGLGSGTGGPVGSNRASRTRDRN